MLQHENGITPPPPKSEACQNPWALSSSGTQFQSGCAIHRPKPELLLLNSLSLGAPIYVIVSFIPSGLNCFSKLAAQLNNTAAAQWRRNGRRVQGGPSWLSMYNIALSVFLKCFQWIGEMVQWLRAQQSWVPFPACTWQFQS